MNRNWIRLVFVVSVVLPSLTAFSCNPLEDIVAAYEGDLHPPRVLGVHVVSPTTIQAEFDEPLSTEAVHILVDPSMPVAEVRTEGARLVVELMQPLRPGAAYAIEAAVRDEASNMTNFVAEVHGMNDRVPELVISELSPRGSGNNPDMVELFCRTGGNLAGVVLMEGSRSSGLDAMVFPSVEVAAGDYLIVHFKPEGTEEEQNEIEDTSASGGKKAHPDAYDFWVEGGDGLSGNNGAVTLYRSPTGPLLDAIIYSNRTSESDERYRGFGSKRVMEMVDEITQDGGWRTAGERAAPEDAVSSDGTTGTRSICRNSSLVDTNGASDWHIVPTRGATFGWKNNDDVYEG